VTFPSLQKVHAKIAADDPYDTGLDYLSLWIPGVLNDVFVAGLPGLVPVYQQ